MGYKELVEELRGFTYWLGQSGPESHDIYPPICDSAATAIENLLEERDAAIEELRKQRCGSCKYANLDATEYPCSGCGDTGVLSDKWEWRGAKLDEED